MSRERDYYSGDDVLVTNARFVCGKKTYAMANITSVSLKVIPAPTWPLVIAITGVIMIILSFKSRNSSDAKGFFFAGVILLSIGLLGHWTNKATYTVTIGSASGETHAVTSQDKEYIENIVDAINDVIIDRASGKG